MIESPLPKAIEKQGRLTGRCDALVIFLAARFGPVPEELAVKLRQIKSERKLEALLVQSVHCTDLDAFRAAMQS
jgi:hypothetical protein